MCQLEPYADAIVGSLDVEHRKRTTIGVELAAKACNMFFSSSFLLVMDSFFLSVLIP